MEKLPGRRVLIGVCALAAVGLIGGYGVAMRARPRSTSVSLASPTPKVADTKLIYVHVGGAVSRPGMYRVPVGSRVDDLVRAAGGALEIADLDALNLAARVKDGDKVLVPKQGAAGAGGPPSVAAPGAATTTAGGASLVNLNSATAADLETLPGIGPALAQKIIAFRTDRGGFRRVEDLLEVPGIGPKKFEELKSHVTV